MTLSTSAPDAQSDANNLTEMVFLECLNEASFASMIAHSILKERNEEGHSSLLSWLAYLLEKYTKTAAMRRSVPDPKAVYFLQLLVGKSTQSSQVIGTELMLLTVT